MKQMNLMNAATKLGIAAALAFFLLPAGAQGRMSADPGTPTEAAANWRYRLGAAVISAPRFVGSNKTRTLAVPTFEVKYKDWFFIDPIKGVGVQTVVGPGLSANAALGVDFATRKRKDDPRLNGLGDINQAPALRLGLDYELGDAFVSANLAYRFGKRSSRGTLLDTDVGYNVVTSKLAIVGVGLNVKGMDSTYSRNFFGVSAEQSAASGLRAFTAKRSLQSFGPFVQAVFPISDRWTLYGHAVYSKLRGDAASSPITEKRNQAVLIGALSYAF